MSAFNESVFSAATGCRLNYAVGPSHGPAIVLFHGVLRCWKDFAPLLTELSLRHHVFALDFRGHGDSPRDPDAKYRVVDYIDDAVTMIQEIVPKPAILYGHSLGAMVAAAVAARQGDQIAGVILEDPPFETMGGMIHQTPLGSYFRHIQRIVTTHQERSVCDIAAALAEIPMEGQEGIKLGDVRDGVSLRFSAACMRRIDPRVLEPIVDAQWLDGYDLSSVLTGISAPTLLLQADQACGGMLTDQDALRFERELKDCIRIKFPGTGHLIHWTKREVVMQHIIGFIEAIQ